ncbi:MAG TPA: 4Fe-4S dicluster domain-containing protein [Burkholderiales bacterium]|nr:4Fe-4S dicluster domain-containing protein [Burkholderiales bacterium]
MPLEDKTLKICNCNRTMALDAKALAAALGAGKPVTIHTELCRKEIAEFESAARGGECVVACTQEAPLFAEFAEAIGANAELRFVNIREVAGWSAEGRQATPKIAALLALADLPEPEPMPSVSYKSGGALLVIGPADVAVQWATRLAGDLEVSVLVTSSRGGDLPDVRRFPVWSGRVTSLKGWLGAFEVEWEQANPIDLEVCTRCNACIRACPEQAIDFTYQIDLERCKAHRECVKACGPVKAIDFDRADRARQGRFDLVLDLSAEPVLRVARKPQGYLAPGRDPLDQALAAAELAKLVGEFEKPKFFVYNERICAHGRSAKVGCTACIDTCSTQAIAPDGDGVRVEPHLCLGCGGCATVCPSGAMTYANPRVSDLGVRLKRLLAVYAGAGGKDAAIVFHGAAVGRDLIPRIARRGRGLPARAIPVEIFHAASIGIDTMLAAIAYGASQVILAATDAESDEYGAAIERQMGHAQAILSALGYAGTHLRLVRATDADVLEAALWSLAPAAGPAKAATFGLSSEKRTTLDFVLEHFARHAPTPREEVPLGAGAPFGRVDVNRQTCTLCMACVGACPASALVDGRETPMLKLIERNCVQCGLCVTTCPENAVTLAPRLLLTAQAKQEVVLNQAEPFNCVRCGKPFGTKQMIDSMVGRLTAHSMFATGGALRRLQMCADCRVIDMMENKSETSIFDVKP